MDGEPLRIFIGWDAAQDAAFRVCRHSLLRHASRPLEILPIKQSEVRERGLYWRPVDPLASTEFTYTRFLVPHLAGYDGWALFMDCDFLVTHDVAELFALADARYAARCVKHDYRPTERTKLQGALQTVYPRKNWSSLVLWNCAHPANRILSPETVNRESGAFLHRFEWLGDESIGELPRRWNWLEGWDRVHDERLPYGIHFTRGGPWLENWRHVDYADLWWEEEERSESVPPPPPSLTATAAE